MNNPFSRFKYYSKGEHENDSQENHATECLAACLVFSPKIRASFIQFLCGDSLRFKTEDESSAEVLTQYPIVGGYIDLLLRKEGVFTIVVEVKVKAAEDFRHEEQLKTYRHWLATPAEQNGTTRLFTLVKNPDSGFKPEKHGVDRRYRWLDLCRHFQSVVRKPDFSDIEVNLINNLRGYMESEGIVGTYETKDLLGYSAGLKAQRAVAGIFDDVSVRLSADGFDKPVFVKGGESTPPRLRISHPKWRDIFGKGTNQKLSLWFIPDGIWKSVRHDFALQIELFHEDHGNDWGLIKNNLPQWLRQLRELNFDCFVWSTWSRVYKNIKGEEITSPPRRIDVWKTDHETILAHQPQKDTDLVDILVQHTKAYKDIVSNLNPTIAPGTTAASEVSNTIVSAAKAQTAGQPEPPALPTR